MIPVPASPVALVAVLVGLSTALLFRHDYAAAASPARLAAVYGVPAAATVALTAVVWTTPVEVWVPAAGGILALAAVLSPLSDAVRVDGRLPTPAELERVGGVPGDPAALRVVEAGPRVAGYAVGSPLSGRVAVSEHALATLSPRAVGALVAHERAHHDGWHVPLRAGVSVGVVLGGTAVVATSVTGMTATAAAILGVVFVERLAAAAVARRLEFAADARAARRTSPAAVAELLASRDAAVALPRPLRPFAAHPPADRRLARLRSGSPPVAD